MLRSLTQAAALALCLTAPSLLAVPAFAADHVATAKTGNLHVEQAWSRATPKSAANGAAFMTLRNAGADADALTSAASTASKTVEIHATIMKDGVMQMRPLNQLDIPAGGAVELKPGGYHIMFIGLKAPLAAGSMVDLTLNFAKAGAVTLKLPVAAAGAPSPMGGTPAPMKHEH